MADEEQARAMMEDVAIGLDAAGMRREFDSMGDVDMPAHRYWSAQTQRSLEHFSIGDDLMPKAVYHAYGYVKKAAALVNAESGRLPQWKADAIVRAADEAIAGRLDDHFPLHVWQTGCGTQSNMNVNEVLSNRAIQLLGGELGSQQPVGPNDDVNMGQSSNDSFPTAMHIAALTLIDGRLLPELDGLAAVIEARAIRWMNVVKVGRTHLQDATPVSYIALVLAGAGGANTLYRFGPDRKKAKWVWITPGSLIAAVLWLLLTIGFGLYVADFGNHNATYGSLGAVIVYLTWLYLSAYVLLLGAEINAELERQTTAGTTVGPEMPIGQRVDRRRSVTLSDR